MSAVILAFAFSLSMKVEVKETVVDTHIYEVPMIQENTLIPRTQILGLVVEDEISILIDKLMMCESGGNWEAVNPKDLDGTPSWGLFQFKPSTWKLYVKKYDLWEWQNFDDADWWNTMMNGDLQRIVVEKMFLDKDVRLATREFPGCSRKLGLKQNYANH